MVLMSVIDIRNAFRTEFCRHAYELHINSDKPNSNQSAVTAIKRKTNTDFATRSGRSFKAYRKIISLEVAYFSGSITVLKKK
jgi:hypothetical protein